MSFRALVNGQPGFPYYQQFSFTILTVDSHPIIQTLRLSVILNIKRASAFQCLLSNAYGPKRRANSADMHTPPLRLEIRRLTRTKLSDWVVISMLWIARWLAKGYSHANSLAGRWWLWITSKVVVETSDPVRFPLVTDANNSRVAYDSREVFNSSTTGQPGQHECYLWKPRGTKSECIRFIIKFSSAPNSLSHRSGRHPIKKGIPCQ